MPSGHSINPGAVTPPSSEMSAGNPGLPHPMARDCLFELRHGPATTVTTAPSFTPVQCHSLRDRGFGHVATFPARSSDLLHSAGLNRRGCQRIESHTVAMVLTFHGRPSCFSEALVGRGGCEHRLPARLVLLALVRRSPIAQSWSRRLIFAGAAAAWGSRASGSAFPAWAPRAPTDDAAAAQRLRKTAQLMELTRGAPDGASVGRSHRPWAGPDIS